MESLDQKPEGLMIAQSVGKVLFKDMSWRGLRPLQESSGAAIRNGFQTLITAGTASGKTEAALLPVLSIILESPDLMHSRTPVALYIAPLKALINDITERLKAIPSFCARNLRLARRRGRFGKKRGDKKSLDSGDDSGIVGGVARLFKSRPGRFLPEPSLLPLG